MALNPDIDMNSPEECTHGFQKRFCYICRGTVNLEYVAKVSEEAQARKQEQRQEQLREAASKEFCSECGYRLTSELINAGVTTHATCSGDNAPIRIRNASEGVTRPAIDRNVVRVGYNHPATSYAAADKALPNSGTKRRILYNLIFSKGDNGLCDHEIEAILGWLHQSASAARNSLMNDGWVINSGKTRKTPQNHNAIVWVAVR